MQAVHTFLEVSVDAAPAVLKLDDRQGEAATLAAQGLLCPTGAVVEAFGAVITTALTNGSGTRCKLAVRIAAPGGSAVTALTLTLPKDATEASAAEVARGARIVHRAATAAAVPVGGLLIVEVLQAAGAAGGAVRPFLVLRHVPLPASRAEPLREVDE